MIGKAAGFGLPEVDIVNARELVKMAAVKMEIPKEGVSVYWGDVAARTGPGRIIYLVGDIRQGVRKSLTKGE